MPEKNKTVYINIIIGLIAALLFIPFIGNVNLFDWDEINFAESAREMIASSDYLTVRINFQPFWEKPPLFIWMQVLSMKIFGINEFAARFPNAVCGIVTLLVLFNTGRTLKNNNFGYLWAILFGGSILPFFYFKSGIIDPWFNLFIFLSILSLTKYFKYGTENNSLYPVKSAFWLGLAIMTKGPAALLIFALVFAVYLVWHKFRIDIKWKDIILFFLVLIFVGGFWFLLQILNGNKQTVIDFINYQIRLFSKEDAGHGGFFAYHFVILLIGVFPASVFALPNLIRINRKKDDQSTMRFFMVTLFWVVLILFSIVNTKIVHYSSLCYFPLTWIAADQIYQLDFSKNKYGIIVNIILIIVSVILLVLALAFPLISIFKWQIVKAGMIKDVFTLGNLQAEVHWPVITYFTGLFLIVGLILYFYFSGKNRINKAVFGITILNIGFIFACILFLTPGIEAISQRANVEFFKSLRNKDAYFTPLGYKSYVHYFYGKKKEYGTKQSNNQTWLLKGEIDKDAYFSIKTNKKTIYLSAHPDLDVLYEKNGFLFCKRKKQK